MSGSSKKTTKTPDPVELWDSVATPPPNALKDFKRPGGFRGTAINPMWVIRRATEVFGPAGIGFGWEVLQDETFGGDNPVHYVRIRLWYQWGEKRGELESYGVTAWMDSRGRADDEAPKKSLTDAIAKGLSWVGIGSRIWYSVPEGTEASGDDADWDPNSQNTTWADTKYDPKPSEPVSPQRAPIPNNGGQQQQQQSGGGAGRGGSQQECPQCGERGVTMKYWEPGSRSPDAECAGECIEEWQGRERPLRWWTVPKRGGKKPAQAPKEANATTTTEEDIPF